MDRLLTEALASYSGRMHHNPDFRVALTDMDGVLYDSMKYHTLCWRTMMLELGLDIPRDEFYLYEGMTGRETIEMIIRRELHREPAPGEAERLYRRKTELFHSMGVKEKVEGADDMLAALGKEGIRRILVTGSGQASLIDSIQHDFPGVYDSDDFITARDVTHGKPHPEPYLRGTERGGVEPWQTIAVENAPLGARSAHDAGCFTVAVTTGPLPPGELYRSGADLVFHDMKAFAAAIPRLIQLSRALGTGVPTDTRRFAPAEKDVPEEEGCDGDNIFTCSTLAEAVERLSDGTKGENAHAGRFCIIDSTLPAPIREEAEAIFGKGRVLAIPGGEKAKDIAVAQSVWGKLSETGATRKSLVVNIGGGATSDLGGFVAATFKRGMDYANIPTTILAAVDASIGGKTGIDLNGLKNEVGAFRMPVGVASVPRFFDTLSDEEVLSGYGEVYKTAFLAGGVLWKETLKAGMDIRGSRTDIGQLCAPLGRMKQAIASADPREEGLRKVLNLGHTAGHALESLAMTRKPVTHGHAVMAGMLVESIMARLKGLCGAETVNTTATLLRGNYSPLQISCNDYPALIDLMRHDKKNDSPEAISFTLPLQPGFVATGCTATPDEIKAALDIFRDMTC